MFFSLCLEIEAYFLLAGTKGWYFMAGIALMYSIVSIARMLIWVRIGYKVLKSVDWHRWVQAFLLSFSSRAASRERLNLFTTNYDRFLEYGCDEVGVILDRFKGKLQPIFRNTRLELDYHYNPPGIRGEPRYVEGVGRITKLHGSFDWNFKGHGKIVRALLPFGTVETHPDIPEKATEHVVI